MKAKTLRDLVRGLKKYDEVTVLEQLDITSEELLDRFEDKVEERFEEIEAFLADEDSTDDEEEEGEDEWN